MLIDLVYVFHSNPWPIFFHLKKKSYFNYLKGEVTERKREIVYLLVYSPNGCDGPGWVRMKPRSWNSIQFSHVMSGRGVHINGPSFSAFVGPQAENSIGSRMAKTQINNSLTHYTPALAPFAHLLIGQLIFITEMWQFFIFWISLALSMGCPSHKQQHILLVASQHWHILVVLIESCVLVNE